MPKYDYLCPSNGQTVEVSHSMSATLETWGQVCDAAGIEPGQTPRDARVVRALGGAMAITSRRGGTDGGGEDFGGGGHSCGPGCCHG